MFMCVPVSKDDMTAFAGPAHISLLTLHTLARYYCFLKCCVSGRAVRWNNKEKHLTMKTPFFTSHAPLSICCFLEPLKQTKKPHIVVGLMTLKHQQTTDNSQSLFTRYCEFLCSSVFLVHFPLFCKPSNDRGNKRH